MSVNNDFSVLNVLRPEGAPCSEVVSIELRYAERMWDPAREDWNLIDAEYLGSSKRKQIRSQPGVNAYWNFMNLRSLITQLSNRKGFSRQTRSYLYERLNVTVRKLHLYELEATYGHRETISHQYYVMTLVQLLPSSMWVVEVREA